MSCPTARPKIGSSVLANESKKRNYLQDMTLLMHRNPEEQLLHQNALVRNQHRVYTRKIVQESE